MRDFLGNEIHAGDRVVIATNHGRNSGATLISGKVVRFTKCFVVCHRKSRSGYSDGEYRTDPKKLIVSIPISETLMAFGGGQ